MCSALLPCPLCSQPRFNNLETLRIGLIKVATENLICPICSDVLMGLDKLTIHLFSHCETEQKNNQIIKKLNNNEGFSDWTKNLQIDKNNEPSTTGISSEATNPGKRPSKHPPAKSTKKDESCSISSKPIKICPKLPIYNMNTLPFIGIPEQISSEIQPQHTNTKCNSKDKIKNCKNKESLSERCDVCGFYFLGKNILEMHKKLIHNIQETTIINGTTKYSCHLCSKVFKMRGSLMVHLRMVHFGVVPSLPKQNNIQDVDMKTQTHSNTNTNTKNCDNSKPAREKTNGKNVNIYSEENYSPKSQDSQESQNIHNKQWECDICHKYFTTKYFLKKHKRLHTGEMPYSCNQCGKTFTFQQSYHKHLLYHNDDKPHACAQCGRAFKELSTLHNHQRIHTGEKPFSCESCGKCFRQRVSYLVHRRIHTGVMPYKCTACDKSFRYKVSQRTHKCTAQPPGMVVRQSGDLVQKLMKNHSDPIKQCEPNPTINDSTEAIENLTNNSNINGFVEKNDRPSYDRSKKQCEKSLTNDLNLNHIPFQLDSSSMLCDPSEIDKNQIEKNIIDEIVNESIIKMNFVNSSPSTSDDFRHDVSDLYSMISPQQNEVENLPSPSEKLRDLKLSSSNENVIENILNDPIFNKNDNASNIFQMPPQDTFTCYNKEFDQQFDCDNSRFQNNIFYNPTYKK